jgi:photosystem II stability/assembly factor-like uncharacterized protein
VRRTVFLVALVGLLAGAAPARDGTSTRRLLNLARLQSRSLGVAATYSVVRCGTDCKSYTPHVFVTGDGHSWHDVTPPHLLLEIEDIAFSTPRAGWVLANDCAAAKAFFYRTKDGGRTWRQARAPATNCAAGSRLDVSFADARHGWILLVIENGSRVGLFRTHDGGKSWTDVGKEAPLRGSILFATPRIGWLARSDLARPGELYATRDGGRSWHKRRLRPPPGWRGARAFPDRPTFFGARGVLPVDLVRGARAAVAFYTTANYGRTWQIRTVRRLDFRILASPASQIVRYVQTSIATPSSWWIAGGRKHGVVAETTDRGHSWHVSSAPIVGSEISSGGARRAWLTTSRGRGALYATSDGGRSWRQLELP